MSGHPHATPDDKSVLVLELVLVPALVLLPPPSSPSSSSPWRKPRGEVRRGGRESRRRLPSLHPTNTPTLMSPPRLLLLEEKEEEDG